MPRLIDPDHNLLGRDGVCRVCGEMIYKKTKCISTGITLAGDHYMINLHMPCARKLGKTLIELTT